jgi:hypothetical protein
MKWDVKWWPTREQWAYRQQHAYWDSADGCPFADQIEHALSHYAEPGEIATLVVQLKQLYRELGREMRAAKLRAGPLLQQPGEPSSDFHNRTWNLPSAEKELLYRPSHLRDDRRMIADVLRGIANNNVPLQARYHSLHGKAQRSGDTDQRSLPERLANRSREMGTETPAAHRRCGLGT